MSDPLPEHTAPTIIINKEDECFWFIFDYLYLAHNHIIWFYVMLRKKYISLAVNGCISIEIEE